MSVLTASPDSIDQIANDYESWAALTDEDIRLALLAASKRLRALERVREAAAQLLVGIPGPFTPHNPGGNTADYWAAVRTDALDAVFAALEAIP